MQIFLVGGAVRDQLLGIEPKDRDFVVVGATVAEFQREFPTAKQIGKAFPVFQRSTSEGPIEYAFARGERKIGPGHTGFAVFADPSVTLADDLYRRDFTINAMACDRDGRMVDPFNGEADLKAGVLRHIGPAFSEDPLRVFRLARFAARFGFSVAPATIEICKSVPQSELEALSGERVGEELRKALRGPFPWRFFEVLKEVGALNPWFKELQALVGVPAGPIAHHQEGDVFEHTLLALKAILHRGFEQGNRTDEIEIIRFGMLVHDLGKALTPKEGWPVHPGHDELGVEPCFDLCERLKLPAWFRKFGQLACREHMRVHNFLDMRKGKMVDLVHDADRTRPGPEGLATVCEGDACGKIPVGSSAGAMALRVAAKAVRAEKVLDIPPSLTGANIGLHIRNEKGKAVIKALREAGLM